jgi:hypothetical protein
MKFALSLQLSSLIVGLPSSNSFLAPQPSSRWAAACSASQHDALLRQQPSCKSRHLLLLDRRLHLSSNNDNNEGASEKGIVYDLLGDTTRTLTFSALMVLCGALLGPFLDSYHSAFGVLQYNDPINIQLWGTQLKPALTTTWWVPELFGLAGFIIGWLYVILDYSLLSGDDNDETSRKVTPPLILVGISLFTGQYWLSGVMSAMGVSRTAIFAVMSVVAGTGFVVFDATVSGFLVSLVTAVGGPLIEVGLISALKEGGYHYTDSGELGFFPLWIAPVYFLGGPAVGNLARGFWKLLSSESAIIPTEEESAIKQPPGCQVCNDSRCVGCPNCDAQGYYVTYGRQVKCNACRGRGLVICRSCFSYYGEDPADIESVREIMSKMPD